VGSLEGFGVFWRGVPRRFPIAYSAFLTIKRNADLKQLLPASFPRQQVFFAVYLGQRFLGGFVSLNSKHTQNFLLNKSVYSPRGDSHFRAAIET